MRSIHIKGAWTRKNGGGGGGFGGSAPANREPTFDEGGKATRAVSEETAEGDPFGEPVTATDRDDDDMLTYTLHGDDADSFGIDATGQLLAKAPLDYETRARYSLEVRVSDGEGDDTTNLAVRVTNVDEPPAITGPGATEYEENKADPVTTYTTKDPEGTGFAWSLAGDDAAVFAISETVLSTVKSGSPHWTKSRTFTITFTLVL